MILPGKHIKISKSLLNVGSILLENINNTQSITMLWNKTKMEHKINAFDKFILGLDFLFILGLVDYKEGIIRKTIQ